jgi:DNA repair protein RadA/Sms
MAKHKEVYRCIECGYASPKWNGRCPGCGEWNTLELEEQVISPVSGTKYRNRVDLSSKIMSLDEINTNADVRYDTGLKELNRVLGGGLVKGSITLLGGEPGIGKSTLLLQICQHLGKKHTILYVSGEESASQLKIRALRLNVDTKNLYILAAIDANAAADTIVLKKPDIAIIDSVQTMCIPEISSSPGSLTQVRECTNLFMHTAKDENIPIFLIGHVNKDGAIAGPKVMEHIVDTVLQFEGDRNMTYRILRTIKNRYGSTNEIGVFEMADKGLKEVDNPSKMLLEGRPVKVSGTCITCVMEGSRPILSEIQTLAAKSSFSSPRRMATGFDFGRLSIIIAVLERRMDLNLGTLDIYLNVVGGFKVDETAGDLAVALSLYSNIIDKPLGEGVMAFGEVGLGGEIRSVAHTDLRVKEAQRLGLKVCIIPKISMQNLKKEDYKIRIFGVANLAQAFAVLKKLYKENEETEVD